MNEPFRPTSEESTTDLSIAEAMEAYLRLIESGQVVDVDRFVAEHGEFQGRLRDAIDSLIFLHGMSLEHHETAELERLKPESPEHRETPKLVTALTRSDNTGDPVEFRQLGDFRLIQEIGRGGMGVVYKAEQLSLGRIVAIKALPFAGLLDQRQLQRFKNEACAAAALKHPHIVSVFAINCDQSVHYYAMEFIEGQDLTRVIHSIHHDRVDRANGSSGQAAKSHAQVVARQGETTPVASLSTQRSNRRREFYRSVARLGAQAANALQFAHRQGVVHRDIKPANLLVDRDGNLHITDFGLAQIPSSENLTATGDQVGTLRYMSPEQLDGRETVDARTDVYSLGLTLYELIAGVPAFPEESRAELTRSIQHREPESLAKRDRHVPTDLRTIIETAMAKSVDDRYRTAGDFEADLQRFLDGHSIKARPATSLTRLLRFSQRNPLVAGLVAALLLLLAIIATGASGVAWNYARELKQRELELYARDMQLAKSAVDGADWREGERLLLNWVPESRHGKGQGDHRGFEWYFLWNACHRKDIERSIAHLGFPFDAAISPDGRWVAEVALYSDRVDIWDLDAPTDAPPETIPIESDALCLRTFGDELLVADRLGRIHSWNWTTRRLNGDPLHVEYAGDALVNCFLDLSPDGRYLVVSAQRPNLSFVLCLYDRQTDSWLWKEPVDDETRAWFDSRGVLTIISEHEIFTREMPAGQRTLVAHFNAKIQGAAWSDDRQQVALAFDSGESATGEVRVEVRRVDRLAAGPLSDAVRVSQRVQAQERPWLTFSPDGKVLAIGADDGILYLANLTNGTVLADRLHQARILTIHFSPDMSRVIVGGEDRWLHVIRLEDLKRQQQGAIVRSPNTAGTGSLGAAFLNAEIVAISRGSESIELCDASTGNVISRRTVDPRFGNLIRLAAHPASGLWAAAQAHWPPRDDMPGRVLLWRDSEEATPYATIEIPHGTMPNGFPLSPDGRFLAVCGRQWVTVIDTTMATPPRVKQFATWVKTTAFSPDGTTLAVSECDNGEITHFLDVVSLNPVREPFVTDKVLPDCTVYLPGTNHLAVVGLENYLRIWDATSGRLICESERYPTFLATLCVSPDGSRVGVGAIDGKYRIFRTSDCAELMSFEIPAAYAYGDFSPDGKSLVVNCGNEALIAHAADEATLKPLSIGALRETAEGRCVPDSIARERLGQE